MPRCSVFGVLLCLLAAAVTPTFCSTVSRPVPVLASVANLQDVIVIISNPNTNTAPAPYPGAKGSSKGTKTIIVDSIDDLDKLAKSIKKQKGQQTDDAPAADSGDSDRDSAHSETPEGSSRRQQQGEHHSQSEQETEDHSSSSDADSSEGGGENSPRSDWHSEWHSDHSNSKDDRDSKGSKDSREESKQSHAPGTYGDSNEKMDRGQRESDSNPETSGDKEDNPGDESSDLGERPQEQQQRYSPDGDSNPVPRFPQKYFPRMVGEEEEKEVDRVHRHPKQQQQQQQQQQQRHGHEPDGSGRDRDNRPPSYDAEDADQPYSNSRGGQRNNHAGRGSNELRNHDSMYDETQDAPEGRQEQYGGGREGREGQYSAGRGESDSSSPMYGMYPRMEEPGPYYQQPDLHTTCLQVIRATQDTQGQATYDLRCCTERDHPRECEAEEDEFFDSPYDSYGRHRGTSVRDIVLQNHKVASCTLTPSTTPCPDYTGGVCQAYTATCVMSQKAVECGCPIKEGYGMTLQMQVYAHTVAGLSCTPVFSIAYAAARAGGRVGGLRAGEGRAFVGGTDLYAPYIGLANVVQGAGDSTDGAVTALMTFITAFGVPAPVQPRTAPLLASRRLLSASSINSTTAASTASLPSYGYGWYPRTTTTPTRQLPTVFDPAPSAPLPLPDLPWFQGGRMIIEWT